jgi:hypothetical protein
MRIRALTSLGCDLAMLRCFVTMRIRGATWRLREVTPARLHSHDAYTLCDRAYTPGYFAWLHSRNAYTPGRNPWSHSYNAYTPGHIAWLQCHNPYTLTHRAYTLCDYPYTRSHSAESHCQRHYQRSVIRWERGARYQRNCGSATGGEDLSAGGKLFRAFPPAWPQPCSKE